MHSSYEVETVTIKYWAIANCPFSSMTAIHILILLHIAISMQTQGSASYMQS